MPLRAPSGGCWGSPPTPWRLVSCFGRAVQSSPGCRWTRRFDRVRCACALARPAAASCCVLRLWQRRQAACPLEGWSIWAGVHPRRVASAWGVMWSASSGVLVQAGWMWSMHWPSRSRMALAIRVGKERRRPDHEVVGRGWLGLVGGGGMLLHPQGWFRTASSAWSLLGGRRFGDRTVAVRLARVAAGQRCEWWRRRDSNTATSGL